MIRLQRGPRRRGRGVTLLEFTLSIPFALVMIMLTLDIGRLVMINTALHEAVTVAARAGARQGYVGEVLSPTCAGWTGSTGQPSYDAFCEVARTIPSADITSVRITSPTTGAGAGRYCAQGVGGQNLYVTVRATARVELMTPLLGTLINGAGSNLGGGVGAAGTARCEVARR